MIDKDYKRKAFDRHAKTYDQYSSLQDKISDNLFKKLDMVKARPSLIFMEDNQLDSTFNYSLWDIDFFLVKGAISRNYRFSEVRS